MGEKFISYINSLKKQIFCRWSDEWLKKFGQGGLGSMRRGIHICRFLQRFAEVCHRRQKDTMTTDKLFLLLS